MILRRPATGTLEVSDGMDLLSNGSPVVAGWPEVGQLEFDSLERFACGCVAVVQRARPWPVTVASVEVQGPHCVLPAHRPGRVVRLGNVWEADDPAAPDDEGRG